MPSVNGGAFSISRSGGIDGAVRSDERPLVWYPMTSNANLDTTNSRNSAIASVQGNAAWQNTVAPYSGVGAVDQTYFVPGDSSSYFDSNIATIGSTGQCLIHYDTRWGFTLGASGTDPNFKMVRIWNTADTSSILMVNMFVQSADVDGDVVSNATPHSYNIPIASNAWYQYQHLFQESSAADVADGLWQHYVDGGAAMPDSNPWTTRVGGTASDSVHHRVFLAQLSNATSNNAPPSGSHSYLGPLYISDTLFHGFISDESTYTTTVYANNTDPSVNHKREIQILGSSGNSTATQTGTLRVGRYTGILSGKSFFIHSSARTRYRVGGWA